jgi:hypothetical protein
LWGLGLGADNGMKNDGRNRIRGTYYGWLRKTRFHVLREKKRGRDNYIEYLKGEGIRTDVHSSAHYVLE